MSLFRTARAATLTAADAPRRPARGRHSRTRRTGLFLGLVVVGSMLLPTAAANAASPRLHLSPAEGAAGTTITVRGYDLPPRSRIQILWNGQYKGYPTAWVHRYGRFRATITVPRGYAGSHHRISVASVAINRTVVTSFSQLGTVRARIAFKHLGNGTSVAPTPTPPAPIPPTPAPVGAVAVPASIDATGVNDASGPLNTWLRTVPNGSTIAFRAGGVYRMNQGLQVHARQNLTFAGQGAMLRSHGTDSWQSSLFIVTASSGIRISNFRLVGNSPTPGSLQFGREYAHAVYAFGSSNVDISNVVVDKVWGDAVAVEDWADGVFFHDSRVITAGRNGVSIMAGRNIAVERVAFERTGGSFLDIEPWQVSGGADRVVFADNTGGTRGTTDPAWGIGMMFAADGVVGSQVSNIQVLRNVLYGSSITAQVTNHTRRRNIVVQDNVSRVSVSSGPYNGPIMNFAHIDGLTVTGNVQPRPAGAEFVRITDSTRVTFR
jgi:hypothetical protein